MLPASAGTVLPQFDSLAGRILLKDFVAALPSLVIGQAANRPCSAHRMRFPPTPYRSTCSTVQRADLQALGQFSLAHSLRPFHLDVLPLSLGQARLPARETPLGPRLRLAATVRSLIEFRHHSLKASTIERWSRPLAVDVSKSSDRDRNSTPARYRPSITCSP